MAKKSKQYLQASILDRLVDSNPKAFRESVQDSYISMGQIKTAVFRDLENLFNTRRCVLDPPATCSEVKNSQFVYGMRDFTSQNPNSTFVRQQLRLDIEKVITMFEPRLRNVTVHIEESSHSKQKIKFRIAGLLVVEPVVEPVTFDTYFDINNSICTISK